MIKFSIKVVEGLSFHSGTFMENLGELQFYKRQVSVFCFLCFFNFFFILSVKREMKLIPTCQNSLQEKPGKDRQSFNR